MNRQRKMVKLNLLLAGIFVLLLTCSKTLLAEDFMCSYEPIPTAALYVDEGSDDFEISSNTKRKVHYSNPLKKKYKTRGRARYCHYVVAPFFYSSEKIYFTERIVYRRYNYYIQSLALRTSSLRGPPSSSII